MLTKYINRQLWKRKYFGEHKKRTLMNFMGDRKRGMDMLPAMQWMKEYRLDNGEIQSILFFQIIRSEIHTIHATT